MELAQLGGASWFVTLMVSTAAGVALLLYGRRQRRRSLRLPPGPKGLPILGSWLLFPGGAITPKRLLQFSQAFGDLCLVTIGCRHVVIVSSPDMAKEVLHARGREFASRCRDFVVELISGHGQDMVFSDYGNHWRNMRRLMTPPFFSTEAFRCGVPMWEEEIDAAIADMIDTSSASIRPKAAQHSEPALSTVGGDNAVPATSPSSAETAAAAASSVKLPPTSCFAAASKSAASAGSSMASPAGPVDGEPLPGNIAFDIVHRRIQLTVYNIIYRMMFDRRFESVDDDMFNELINWNRRNGVFLQNFRYNVAEFFPLLRVFFGSLIREVQEANRGRLQMFKDVFIKERSEKPAAGKRPSGIDFLLDAESRGEITMKSVLLLVQNVNAVAINTIMKLLSWGVIELANQPKVQKKLRVELECSVGKGGCLKHKDIVDLPYLQAVVKEVLRMYMPGPLLVPHTNEQQVKLGGYDIPANSKVLVNAWGIARDKRFWSNPEEFCPERFMEEKVDVFGGNFTFLPFGSGTRGCPGARIAFTILALMLGKLVQAFELQPPLGEERVVAIEVFGQFGPFINNHINMIFKPHNHADCINLPYASNTNLVT